MYNYVGSVSWANYGQEINAFLDRLFSISLAILVCCSIFVVWRC